MKDFTKIVFAVAFVFMVIGGAAQANTIGGDVTVDVRTSETNNVAIGEDIEIRNGAFHACGTDIGGDVDVRLRTDETNNIAIGSDIGIYNGSVAFGDNSCLR